MAILAVPGIIYLTCNCKISLGYLAITCKINEMIKCVFMLIFRVLNKGFLNTVVLFFISYSEHCSSVSRIENHS